MYKLNQFILLQFRLDQDITASLNIGDANLKEYMEYESSILHTKFDNASCLYGSLIPEVVFKFCKENDFQLIRYDLNESCK